MLEFQMRKDNNMKNVSVFVGWIDCEQKKESFN